MSRIWPSQKTASGWKGGCAVKAAGTSSLRHAIHEESMVMLMPAAPAPAPHRRGSTLKRARP